MAGEIDRIAYDLTRADYIRWGELLQKRGAGAAHWAKYREQRRSYVVFALVGTAVWCWWAWVRLPEAINGRGEALSVVVPAAGIVCVWWYISEMYRKANPEALRRALMAQADSERVRLMLGQHRIMLTRGFLEIDGRHQVSLIRWSQVGVVERVEEFVFIEFGGDRPYAIPARAFRDEAHIAEFIAEAAALRDASPVNQAEEVAGMLRSRDFNCPGCGYNLRGIEKGVCPECGRVVRLGDVAGAG